ncbi:unnamed protein product, partial [Brassica oleracea var. botrytis]
TKIRYDNWRVYYSCGCHGVHRNATKTIRDFVAQVEEAIPGISTNDLNKRKY